LTFGSRRLNLWEAFACVRLWLAARHAQVSACEVVAGARGAAGSMRQRLILWRSSLRYDFAKHLGLGTAPWNSLRALRALRSNSHGESVTKRFAPAPRPSCFAATEIAAAAYRPPHREECWYSAGGAPTGLQPAASLISCHAGLDPASIVASQHRLRRSRVRVGCVAQSGEAPAMRGFALGAKRFVNMLIAAV
jgi:hypothetical protein